MDIKYMLACIFMSMGPAKHEKVAIFPGKICLYHEIASICLMIRTCYNQFEGQMKASCEKPELKK